MGRRLGAHVVSGAQIACVVAIALFAASCSLISGASDLEISKSKSDAAADRPSVTFADDGSTDASVEDAPRPVSDAGSASNDSGSDGGSDGGACRALNESCGGLGGPGGGNANSGSCCAPLFCGDARKCLKCLPLFDNCTTGAQCCSGTCAPFAGVCQ